MVDVLEFWTCYACVAPYVYDLCVILLSRNEQTEVCEIIELFIGYVVEKNTVMCKTFLQSFKAV